MARIKVTGYLNTEDYPNSDLDLESASGLTEEAYDREMDRLVHLDDALLELEDKTDG